MGEDAMKTCPVCGAECFKDMETCFSCLHVFDAQDACAADRLTFGIPADCDFAAEEEFVPEEAVAVSAPACGINAPGIVLDGETPVQLRIVVDLSGLAPRYFQKS